MAGLGTVEFKDAMKTLYLGPLNDNTFRATVLLNRLEKNSENVHGNFAYIPVITGRNPAVGSRKEVAQGTGAGPKFPAHGNQSYSKLTFHMGQHYGRGSISGVTKRKSSGGSEGAFASALDTEMKGLMESLPEDLNRQICGYGLGRAASLAGTAQATSTAINVDSRDPMFARIGDRVHFADITAGSGITPSTGTTISDITYNSGTNQHTITLAAASGTSLTTADDAMYFGGGETIDAEVTSRGQEILGIFSLVDDGNIGADLQVPGESGEIMLDINTNQTQNYHTYVGGVVRSSNAWLQSTVLKNPVSAGTNRPITETILKEAILTLQAQNGSDPSELEAYMGPGTWGTLGMTQVGSRLYNDFKETVEMGFSSIVVDGIKHFFDRDIVEGKIVYMNMKHVMLLTGQDYEFIDTDGNILRNITDRDAWEFAINRDCQLGYNNGRKHLLLDDLTTTMNVNGGLH